MASKCPSARRYGKSKSLPSTSIYQSSLLLVQAITTPALKAYSKTPTDVLELLNQLDGDDVVPSTTADTKAV
jgi:hypothetical protein